MPPSSSPAHADAQAVRDLAAAYDRLTDQIGKAVIGHKAAIEQLLIALFSRGHCLLVGPPGLAKALLASTLARALNLSFKRAPCTPDMLPADFIGTEHAQEDPETGRRRMVFLPGPLFANVILAEEVNRAPPKALAALGEALQENQVTGGGQIFRLPDPFLVCATQNPLEQEGGAPLPWAQQDRFMFSVRVDYPSRNEEIQLLKATTGAAKTEVTPVVDPKQIGRFQDVVRQVVVADHVFGYAADLIRATRSREPSAPKFLPELVAWGAGPRASQDLILAAKARAVLNGRFHATTEDIRAVILPVLRHRIMTTFHADAEGITTDTIVGKLLEMVPNPVENGVGKSRKG
jgi:MoxR-like ATPase